MPKVIRDWTPERGQTSLSAVSSLPSLPANVLMASQKTLVHVEFFCWFWRKRVRIESCCVTFFSPRCGKWPTGSIRGVAQSTNQHSLPALNTSYSDLFLILLLVVIIMCPVFAVVRPRVSDVMFAVPPQVTSCLGDLERSEESVHLAWVYSSTTSFHPTTTVCVTFVSVTEWFTYISKYIHTCL